MFLYDLLLNTALLLSKLSVNLVVIYKNYWSYQDKEEKNTLIPEIYSDSPTLMIMFRNCE